MKRNISLFTENRIGRCVWVPLSVVSGHGVLHHAVQVSPLHAMTVAPAAWMLVERAVGYLMGTLAAPIQLQRPFDDTIDGSKLLKLTGVTCVVAVYNNILAGSDMQVSACAKLIMSPGPTWYDK